MRYLYCLLLFSFLLTGCTTNFTEKNIKPVSEDKLVNINFGSYFPQVGASLKYELGDSNGIKKDNVFTTNTAGERVIMSAVFMGNNNISQTSSLYSIQENMITLLAVENKSSLGNSSTKPNEIILSTKPQWNSDASTIAKITGVNLNVSTKAGTFPNTIEVTKITKVDNQEILRKDYYSPGVGLILEKMEDGKVVSELTEYKFQNDNTNLTQESINSSDDINAIDQYGVTKLARKAGEGDIESVKKLLADGADPNLCKEYGEPPLLWAVRSNRDEIVRILLEAGANPNFKSPEGVTALKVAKDQGANAIINYLLKYGANE